MRVAVITPIPTPYRDPFWSRLAAHPLVDLDVFYCSAGKRDRPWSVTWSRDFRWETLPGRNLAAWRGADASCYWNPEIGDRLTSGMYDAIVVGGYNHPTMLSAVACAERHRIPYFMMCETYYRPRSPWKSALKRILVGHVLRRAAGTFPTGKLSKDYVLRYGASPAGVVAIPNVPDVEALAAESQRLRAADGSGDELPVVLFVGRLIPKKRPHLLINAFARTKQAAGARLVIVGDGPERPALEQQVRDLRIGDRVEFTGFVQPQSVVRWYTRASVFVLPSSETWGVSTIEALSCRTPVVVTNEVGCHPDVVTDARVGRVVAAGDEADLADALSDLLSRRPPPNEVEDAWRETWQKFRYAALAEQMVGGLRQGLTA